MTRADRRAALQQSIVTATVDAIVERGADSVTMTEIAQRAGVSRPTAYATVGSVSGAFAEVWLAFAGPWLAGVVDPTGSLGTGPGGVDGRVRTALTELVLIAGRDAEVAEVVRRDLNRLWAEGHQAGETALLRSVWFLATAIGLEASRGLSSTLDAGVGAVGLLAAMPETAREMVGLPDAWSSPPPSAAPLVLAGRDPDEVTAALVDASVVVVASSGVVGASMLRICRVAGVTTGAGRPRFHSLTELILAGFAYEIGDVVKENVGVIATVSGADDFVDLYAGLIPSGLGPERELWRLFRQEMHLGARVNPALRDALAGSIAEAEGYLAAVVTGPSVGFPDDIAAAGLGINQLASVGMPALHRLGLPVSQLDHRVALRWIHRTAVGAL